MVQVKTGALKRYFHLLTLLGKRCSACPLVFGMLSRPSLQYVEALEQMFLSFKATLDPNKRNSFGGERIADYKSRIDYLKRLAHPQLHVEVTSLRNLRRKPSIKRPFMNPVFSAAVEVDLDNQWL